mmetsp:Transcript_51902/g.168739  ORF Transcript_51902/g.168739 Transcript_51902/m.168739 type:complete len:166 (-) Transcript_51902:427-924(-)
MPNIYSMQVVATCLLRKKEHKVLADFGDPEMTRGKPDGSPDSPVIPEGGGTGFQADSSQTIALKLVMQRKIPGKAKVPRSEPPLSSSPVLQKRAKSTARAGPTNRPRDLAVDKLTIQRFRSLSCVATRLNTTKTRVDLPVPAPVSNRAAKMHPGLRNPGNASASA